MIWQNPWAWLGLLTVALPVLIHLLARLSARVQPFPTLRFLDTSRLLPTRRTRLQDVLLLCLRVAILAVAVSALAQPLFLAAPRERSSNRSLARVVIVDTSNSMLRRTGTGERALDAARRQGRRAVADADYVVLLETVAPARALVGAVAWLDRQPARRELVIISDFQLGTFESADLAGVPNDVGVRLQRVAANADSTTLESVNVHGSLETVALSTLTDSGTTVEWTFRPAANEQPDLRILAGASERERSDAALLAARTSGHARVAATGPIVVVQPNYEGRGELLRRAKPIEEPWMGNIVARLHHDPMLAAAAAHATVLVSGPGDSLRHIALARTDSGRTVAFATSGTLDDRSSLLIFSLADAGSITTAALLSATANALGRGVPVTELEPRHLSDDVLEQWQRPTPATGHRVRNVDDASDARWFWVVVLVLLFAEGWLRRRQQQRPHEQLQMESARELVA